MKNDKNISKNNSPEQEYGLFDMLYIGLKDLVKLMQDIRFAAIVLIILAIATLIGTALPQIPMAGEGARDQLIAKFGQNNYDQFIKPAGFDQVFQTVWYRFLLLLIVVSTTLCAWSRTRSVAAISKRKNPVSSEKGVAALKYHGTKSFESKEQAESWIDSKQKKFGFQTYKGEKDGEFHLFGRKNLLSKWMLVAMHYSFVLMLLGAIIGSAFGREEYTRILEGNSWETEDGWSRIRLIEYWIEYDQNDFPDVESYFSGKVPSSYKSHLQALDPDDNSEIVKEKVISVNNPLNHNGYNYYQSSWDYQPIISVYHEGEKIARSFVSGNKPYQIPDTDVFLFFPGRGMVQGKLRIQQQDKTYAFEDIPPMCILFQLDMKNHKEMNLGILSQNEPIIVTHHGETYEIHLDDMLSYSVFQVKRDPGVGIVFVGFIICMIGGTWGMLVPYGIFRSLVRKKGQRWEVVWGTTLQPFSLMLNESE